MLCAEESAWLTDPHLNLSTGMGEMITTKPAEHTLSHNQTLALAGTTWQVRHTPGHSPGSVSLIHEPSNQAIVGDTLFAGSIGRFDFPTSNEQDLYRAIREQLYTLNPETRVFPGHGPTTTIANEMRNNPYVRAG
jgi:glyoxylase-like metal-dependent hydrolase (beta-lactamase superfamily II)